jgi:hypothetical protein
MAAPASPTNTSAKSTLATALRQLAHNYVRKGGKQSRRKRVDRLCLALDWIAQEFPACRGLEQIGRKHVWRFYQTHSHLSEKTLAEYGYAFRLLWELLGRAGESPWPKTPESATDGRQESNTTLGSSLLD